MAEREEALPAVYVSTEYLSAALDHANRRCFIIGRTGSGKSALLRMVAAKAPGKTVQLAASDLTFREVELSEAIGSLHKLGGNLSYLFKTIWKHLLVVTILRLRYPELKQRIGMIRSIWMSITDPVRRQAYEYLLRNEELYGDRTFADRLTSMLRGLEANIEATMKAKGVSVAGPTVGIDEISVSVSASTAGEFSDPATATQARKRLGTEISSIVERSWQVPQLHQALEVLRQELKGAEYWVLIDDLDKAFAGSALSSEFIKCLFEVVMEMSHFEQLKFLVALRTNIFNRLNFFQREKTNDYCMVLYWSPPALQTIAEQRIQYAIGAPNMPVFGKDALFAATVRDAYRRRQVKTFDYLRSRTLDRPRDLLAFMQAALELSQGKDAVTADVITLAERRYSRERLNALADEWQEEEPGLDLLAECFRRTPRTLTSDQLVTCLQSALLSICEDAEAGSERRIGAYMARFRLASYEDIGPNCGGIYELARIFWNVGILGVKLPGQGEWIYSNPPGIEPNLSPQGMKGCVYRIHPMFQQALEISTDGSSPDQEAETQWDDG